MECFEYRGEGMEKLSEEEIELIEKKKEYLKQFQKSVRACRRLEEQIRELEADEMCPSTLCFNGIPLASSFNNRDLSVYMARKDKLLSDMIKARCERITIYQNVFQRIECMNDEDEKTILTLRYIKGLKWENIASHMHMAYSWIHKLHAKALVNFELPKEETQRD